jgi:hypothetical protein
LLLAEGGRILQGWPVKPGDLERLLVDCALILIGSAAHLAVEALKSSQNKKQPSFDATDDLVLWAHIPEASLRNGIFYVWLGYILLVVGVPGVEWSTAFFAGYSIDSVTDVSKNGTMLLSGANARWDVGQQRGIDPGRHYQMDGREQRGHLRHKAVEEVRRRTGNHC